MYRLGKQEEVIDYFERKAASNSYLKNLRRGIAFLAKTEQEMYYEEKGHLVIGSAVDYQITQGKEAFNEQYHVSRIIKPSDTVMSMINQVFDHAVEVSGSIDVGTLHSWSDAILASADDHKYQTRWKEETRINKIAEMGFDYFEDLKLAFGKQILSDVESNIISNIIMSLETNKYTSKYLKTVGTLGVNFFFQVPIYFTYDDVECKVLLDIVIVDTLNETILPIDLKTTSGFPVEFPDAVKKFGYNFQGSFYTEGLNALLSNPENVETLIELKEIVNEEFEILPFKFMVETTKYKTNKLTGETQYFQGSPLMFTLSEEQLDLGKYGRPEIYLISHSRADLEKGQIHSPFHPIKYKPIIGFEYALELYKWHEENGYEVDKVVMENNGDLII